MFADKGGFCRAFQVTFSPGTVLFREGDPPEDIYLLVEGEVSWRDCAKGKGWETETWKLLIYWFGRFKLKDLFTTQTLTMIYLLISINFWSSITLYLFFIYLFRLVVHVQPGAALLKGSLTKFRDVALNHEPFTQSNLPFFNEPL